jgi:hypothetical protein
MVHLSPKEAADQLERRIQQLEPHLKAMEHSLEALRPMIGRINALELEYEYALCKAELDWVQKLSRDQRSGVLAWDIELILGYLRTLAKSKSSSVDSARKQSESTPGTKS